MNLRKGLFIDNNHLFHEYVIMLTNVNLKLKKKSI
jgi:hypothetical protein